MPEHSPATDLKLLLIDPDSALADRLDSTGTTLSSSNLVVTHVQDVANAVELLHTRDFDALLLVADKAHVSESFTQGGSPLAQLQKVASHLPIILLTTQRDDDTSLWAGREGAEHYLVHADFDRCELRRVVRHAIERKRVENRLRQSEEFFRLISENVTDLIAVLDRNGRRLYNNPAYQRSLGPRADLTGTDSFHEIHPEDRPRIQAVFQETLASGQGQRAEYRLLHPDGSIRYIESLGSLVLDPHGLPDKIVVVSRDITERRQAMNQLERTLDQLRQAHAELHAAQARLVQTEKIEALSTFAAGIAHEVRNPLQTILLGIDFLRENLRDTAAPDLTTCQLVLTELENGARKADAVIQGLLEFTAYRQQEIQEHNLSQLLEQSLHTVAAELEQRRILVRLELDPQLPLVRVDARKIRHVLIKLLLGFAERLPAESRLTLRTRRTDAARRISPLPPRDAPLTQPCACIEMDHAASEATPTAIGPPAPTLIRKEDLDLMVVKKVVELYGGIVETRAVAPGFVQTRMQFRAEPQEKL